MRRFLPALLVLASVSQLRAQEVPADALEHLLEAGRDRLSAGNGWALVVAGHGTLPSSNAADTLDIPVESDWNYLIAVCLNCAGRIGAGVGMDIYAPDGRDIGNSYSRTPREVAWGTVGDDGLGTHRAVLRCPGGCAYVVGLFQERRERRGEVWDERGKGG